MPNYIVRLKIGQKEFNARTEAEGSFHAKIKAHSAAAKKFPGEAITVHGCVEDFEKALKDVMGGIFK